MPEVADVAVFGVPDDEFGERVHAAVQLRPGATATADQVIEYARARMARFKAPRQVSFHTELPRTEHGKILKRLLRASYWAGRTSRL
jgi:long-chain acyl-CoA synthetase